MVKDWVPQEIKDIIDEVDYSHHSDVTVRVTRLTTNPFMESVWKELARNVKGQRQLEAVYTSGFTNRTPLRDYFETTIYNKLPDYDWRAQQSKYEEIANCAKKIQLHMGSDPIRFIETLSDDIAMLDGEDPIKKQFLIFHYLDHNNNGYFPTHTDLGLFHLLGVLRDGCAAALEAPLRNKPVHQMNSDNAERIFVRKKLVKLVYDCFKQPCHTAIANTINVAFEPDPPEEPDNVRADRRAIEKNRAVLYQRMHADQS